MSLLTELKRRNVFRAGLAYGITAWLVAQVAGLAAAAFFAPDWVMKMIITVLILGLPLAMLMAWAYEMTPQGLRRESLVEEGQSTARATAGKLDKAIMVALVLAVAYIAYDKLVLDPRRETALLEGARVQEPVEAAQASALEDTPPSIAVLPFVNMSDDPGNEYFSEGLSEELLNLLVRIPELKVAARTSSFSYKGKDVKIAQIGKELNVAHVLEGSVRKAAERVRITAQLIKADDGYHLWSETYDRTLDDIFAIQDEIAAAVVKALRVTLLNEAPQSDETDPRVYALYMKGKHFENLSGEGDFERAEAAYREALAIDPDYAPIWVHMQRIYVYKHRIGELSREEALAKAMEALEKALSLNESLAEAWSGMAYVKKNLAWDWAGAQAAIDRALALEPNNANVVGVAASLASNLGRSSESLKLYKRSSELDPLSLVALSSLAQAYRRSGMYDEAIATFERLRELNPGYWNVNTQIARTYLLMGEPEMARSEYRKADESTVGFLDRYLLHEGLGNHDEAQAALAAFKAAPPEGSARLHAFSYAWIGDLDKAFEWLEVAYERHEEGMAYILGSVITPFIEHDPRFPLLLEKMGLLEYWKGPSGD